MNKKGELEGGRKIMPFYFIFNYDIGELHSIWLHVAEHTVQQFSLLIKFLQASYPTHHNQLPGNLGAFHP